MHGVALDLTVLEVHIITIKKVTLIFTECELYWCVFLTWTIGTKSG